MSAALGGVHTRVKAPSKRRCTVGQVILLVESKSLDPRSLHYSMGGSRCERIEVGRRRKRLSQTCCVLLHDVDKCINVFNLE